jgi:predicted transcriptional regulator
MKADKRDTRLTPLELEIMNVLWRMGPAPVQKVQEALQPSRPLAYTSVQTMLNVLHRKGKVRRKLRDRAYHYEAALSRQSAIRGTLRDVIDRFFGGSPESLGMNLVETRELTPEKLAELKRLVDEKEGKPGGSR